MKDILIGRRMGSFENKVVPEWISFHSLGLVNIKNLTFLNGIDLDNFFVVNNNSSTFVNITIGNNIKNYPEDLSGFSRLKTLTLSDFPKKCPKFTTKQYMDMIIYVPKGTLAAYQEAEGWKNFWDIREIDESGIDDAAVVDEKVEIGRYDLQGRRVGEDYRGMVIVRFSDGSVRKTIVR